MSVSEETPMQTNMDAEPVIKQEIGASAAAVANENFVVLDMAGDSEDSDKEDKAPPKETKERPAKVDNSEESSEQSVATESTPKPATITAAKPRVRTKPKAPVVDVNSLRKRKWQLKVYPLHAEDLQLTYMSILCKLASESLLYIPSEGRHGKAELYVATQKETAAINGKLLRMGFHHKMLSIEVVRKDTGGKEDGDESKKECKAFLMFDKFLSKKIFDAKKEKGTPVEKIVTLHKLPKAATKDFVGALFPFATDIEIVENDDPDERKALVTCKTPVTSLLVYKSFKRLEINDVHVKLSVDDSVKAISLPPIFFMPPPENKGLGGPSEMTPDGMNQSSMPMRRPLPPMMNPLNRRVQQIKKRALLTRRKPLRGPLMGGQRPNGPEDLMGGPRGSLLGRPMMRRLGDGPRMMNRPGPGMRDIPMGPGRRRMNERMTDRRNRDRDSRERKGRREDGDSTVTKEMLQLQNQLNQAIKNQIAMLNTAQTSGAPIRGSDTFQGASGHRTSLLGHGPTRHFGTGSGDMGNSGPNRMDHQPNSFGSGSSWSGDRGRMDRGGPRGDRGNRPDKMGGRSGGPSLLGGPGGRADRSSDRGASKPAGRMDSRGSDGRRGDRIERDRSRDSVPASRSGSGRSGGFGSGGGDGGGRNVSKSDSHRSGGHHGSSQGGSDSARATSRGRRPEFSSNSNSRSSQRNDPPYSSGSHGQGNSSNRYGDYSQNDGDNNSYYRRY